MKNNKQLWVLVLLVFWGCKAKQEMTTSTPTTATKMQYEKTKLSPFGHKLWLQVEKEQNANKTNYTPSESTIKEFGLREMEGVYYVNAIIQVEKDMPNEELEKLGVKPRTKVGMSIRTASIPITQLATLTQLAAVKYIETDTSLSTK